MPAGTQVGKLAEIAGLERFSNFYVAFLASFKVAFS